MYLEEQFDVAVIGGGPAGLALAIGLRQKDLRVVVIECGGYDSRSGGETVPSDVAQPLYRLGAWKPFAVDAHIPSARSSYAWGSSDLEIRDGMFSPLGAGWNLNRTVFDKTLARLAAERGAEVRTGTQVSRIEKMPGGGWKIHLDYPAGKETISACFLADATGSKSKVALACGATDLRYDSLMALSARFSSDGNSLACSVIETVPYGWWHASRIHDGGSVVSLMTDADLARSRAMQKPSNWLDMLLRTRHVRQFVTSMNAVPEVVSRTAVSHKLEKVAGKNWVAVGDAAMSFDPLSAAGITSALSTALDAAEALAARLAGDSYALIDYDYRTQALYKNYLAERKWCYCNERRWPSSEFWQRRRDPGTACPANGRVVSFPSIRGSFRARS